MIHKSHIMHIKSKHKMEAQTSSQPEVVKQMDERYCRYCKEKMTYGLREEVLCRKCIRSRTNSTVGLVT